MPKPIGPIDLHKMSCDSALDAIRAWQGDPDLDPCAAIPGLDARSNLKGSIAAMVADCMHLTDDAGLDWADVMASARSVYETGPGGILA